jgi:diacylglycerol kinase family enzyme
MWRGNHITSDAVRRITFKKLRIEADSPFWIQTDGEPRGSAQCVEIGIQPQQLKMLMPPRGMELLKDNHS